MVFFPGGNFQQGTAGFDFYDGRFMVQRGNVIVVTVNYRLGALGWIYTAKSLRGNYGLQDQRVALKWVKDNIQYFGGDPNQVTIFGQSAGATSVCVHLTSSKSAGLFTKAIIESNPLTLPMKTVNDATAEGDLLLKSTGCTDDLQCLRKLSLDKILDAQDIINKNVNFESVLESFYPWTPIIDGVDVTVNPLVGFQSGNYQKVPIMIGSVNNEATLFIYKASKSEINDLEYIGAVEYIFGLITGSKVLYRYPPRPFFGDKRPCLGDLGTDYIFLCPGRNLTLSVANDKVSPIYYYHYNHICSFAPQIWIPDFRECLKYVCHSEELILLWGTPPLAGLNYTKDEQVLSNLLIDYWTNFVRNGDPNKGNQVPNWPPYSSSAKSNMKFQVPQSIVETNWDNEDCNFFDSVGYHFGWELNEK